MRRELVGALAVSMLIAGAKPLLAAEDWPPSDQLAVIEPVRSFHEHRMGDRCKEPPIPFNTAGNGDRAWRLPPLEHNGARRPGSDVPRHLVRIFCGFGAYNVFHNWYFAEANDRIVPILFSEPHFDIEYAEDAQGNLDVSKVLAIQVNGFSAEDGVYNAEFDPQTQTIEARFWARGQGDAFDDGDWIIDGEEIFLKLYAADVTVDGAANPVVVYDASKAKPIEPLLPPPQVVE